MKYIIASLFLSASPVLAESVADFGTTNPDEMTLQRFVERAEDGETGMVLCSMGYALTKSGDHASARTLLLNCAEDGYAGAMTWMGQLENNGLGGAYDPHAAAEWNRRAAELGDPVGKFNHGIDLMRGYGVRQNKALGQQLIDEAAASGLPQAQRLADSDYDLDVVTPDADNWRYAPIF